MATLSRASAFREEKLNLLVTLYRQASACGADWGAFAGGLGIGTSRPHPEAMMELVDTHCHLTEPPLRGALDEVLARARGRGVTRVIAPAYDHASWPLIREVATRPGVSVALGLHPWRAEEGIDEDELTAALNATNAVAVGEVGLDFKIQGFDRDAQLSVLRRQLRVAAALDLPVILHCRGAFEELLALLAETSPRPRGVIHAFSRGPELARRFMTMGLSIGVGGAVTRELSRVRKSITAVGADKLLLETDAPSIGLEGVLPEAAEPQHVAEIAHVVAALRGMTIDDVAAVTTANAERLFRLPASEAGRDS